MKKISILMPTYNDCESIIETLDSVMMQTYQNWELIIVDDGSTDDTKKVITEYKEKNDLDNKIKYYYQENADQLNAVKKAASYMKDPDYVFILHSDDLFNAENVLKYAVDYFYDHDVDGIIADIITIDEKSTVTGIQKVLDYKKSPDTLALELLWLGRNLYVDTGFWQYKTFMNDLYDNYLTWNMPAWISKNGQNEMLNIEKVDFPFFKYRVFEGNYINNELGKMNVINGELRTSIRLMQYYDIPNYQLQYFIFRVFNKVNKFYKPIYKNREFVKKAEVIDFIIKKRYPGGYGNNIFLNSLYLFYKNNSNRSIEIKNIKQTEKIYLGSDMRHFNKAILENTLSQFYVNILKEMQLGFNEIKTTEKDYGNVINITKFLCLFPFVNITIEE